MTAPENTPGETYVGKIFTTHKKPRPKTIIDINRKGSIVKERCKQLTDMIIRLFPERIISHEDLVCLVQDYIGADKETVRSYCGYGGYIRAGRCGDNKIVGLSRKGYLEVFGFLKKMGGRRWGVVQTILCEPSVSYQTTSSEGVSIGVESNEKISISTTSIDNNQQSLAGRGFGGNSARLPPTIAVVSSKEREEEEASEKDRNFSPKITEEELEKRRNLCPKNSPMILENDTAKAKPTEKEPS